MTDIARAPWTPEQVENLNAWQKNSHVHPFTCGPCRDADPDQPPAQHELVATEAGWVCPTCDYTQDWAHAMAANAKPVEFKWPWE